MSVVTGSDLAGARVAVEVPATTANLGAGYDCLGMALQLTNRIVVEVVSRTADRVELDIAGEGEGELSGSPDNRLVRGLDAALAARDIVLPDDLAWRIRMRNGIPLERGLGSSAAATVAGLVAANAMIGEPLTQADLLRHATAIEGHPDNAAPALLGGFVVAGQVDGGHEAIRFDVPRAVQAVLFIPERRLATADMRRVLPTDVPLADAVANLGRVALGVAGLASGRHDLLRALTIDRLHEPYRAAAYPELPILVAAARAAGAIGACLSGSGSTIIAFTDTDAATEATRAALTEAAARIDMAGRADVVAPRNTGAEVVIGV